MKVEYFKTEYLLLFVLAFLFEEKCALGGNPRTITMPLRKYRETHKTTKEKRDVPESDINPKYHDNLSGRPGQGYYLAIQLGTPPQLVSFRRNNFKLLICLKI
jgi:hypothetical protein